MDCHWLAAWEMCPRFVSGIPDPLLEDHALQTAAVLLHVLSIIRRVWLWDGRLLLIWPFGLASRPVAQAAVGLEQLSPLPAESQAGWQKPGRAEWETARCLLQGPPPRVSRPCNGTDPGPTGARVPMILADSLLSFHPAHRVECGVGAGRDLGSLSFVGKLPGEILFLCHFYPLSLKSEFGSV